MVRGGGVRPFRSVRVLEVRTVTSDWRFRSHALKQALAHAVLYRYRSHCPTDKLRSPNVPEW